MGQYWKLINLDKRQTYGDWGKLGECLFDGSPSCLKTSLRATAEKLPDCDSLIFPFKPGALFEEAYESRPATYFPKAADHSLNAKALPNLPLEMIHEIYLNAEDLADVICLSMTCQFLWEVGRGHIYRHIVAIVASYSWVGDRIICVGDYLRNEDIPDSLLTPEEKVEFTSPDPDDDGDFTLYSYPFDVVGWGGFSIDILLKSAKIVKRYRSFYSYLITDGQILSSLCNEYYTLPALTQLSVLRNLSRHQYVRESALIAWREGAQAKVKETKNVGFGEIVLSRICLSTDPSASMSYDGDIHRGVWAGDRFDLVSSETEWLEGLGEDSGWTDVSDKVLEEVEEIWKSEYRYN
ncbi:hypothetical protein DFH07DRAFT_876915 [Mycena maculata]|uniref:F-box domain-containing protein n=1 Tax=Mycena maculata TaxID=230809 RepID=A0AAD7K6K9_9AGAR|nr:hypothetical protein DFH07DRAFT_876915 [Mycena maculata]